MPHQVYIDPARKKPRYRPFEAMARMQRLIADKEDTEQVFHIVEALNGNALEKNLRRFASSERGAARLSERTYLPDMLDDHDALRTLPEGSVGRKYIDFMEREGLTAAGLVEESLKFRRGRPVYDDDVEYFGDRLRDTHDLFHVLTGYGRDPLGEASVLAFSHGQNPSFGIRFIYVMGARQIAKHTPRETRIMDVIREGRDAGRAAEQIAEQDIRALLAEPIDAARARLGIGKPVLYRRALKIISDQRDPQTVLAAA